MKKKKNAFFDLYIYNEEVKFLEQTISFTNDIFFKYCFGQNNENSIFLRRFLLEHLIDCKNYNLIVDNPELVSTYMNQKTIRLDITMNHNSIGIGIEMQNTVFSHYLRKRFQYYICRNISNQLKIGDKNYHDLKTYCQIVLINDENEFNNQLISSFNLRDEEGIILKDCLINIILIYLKNAFKLQKQKDCLNEFEAMIYLLAQGELKGVRYDEQKGVVTLMEKKKKRFEKNDGYMSLALTYEEEEALRKIEMNYVREEGKEEGRNMMKLDILKRLLMKKYDCGTIEWLENCSAKQLDSITELILEDISYIDLQNKVLA